MNNNRQLLANLLRMPQGARPLVQSVGGGMTSQSDIPPETRAAMIMGSSKTPEQKASQWSALQQSLPQYYPNMGLPVAITTGSGRQTVVIDSAPSDMNWLQRTAAAQDAIAPLRASGEQLIGNVAGSWYFDPNGGLYGQSTATPRKSVLGRF